MAVVQISKIQVRKGQKLKTGIPQLSGGEFAWAVDTQELYIGNGSVTEGSPAVGNTKVITEYDNILELSRAYTFAQGEPSITASVPRSLQSKLDEYVSILDYGATGDGSSNNSIAIQAALDDLFLNEDPVYRKALFFPTGTYLCLTSIRIPTNAIMIGESNTDTVLNFVGNNITMKSLAGTAFTSFTSTDRPENINVSNLKFKFTSGFINLTGLKDSKFESVVFEGAYALGDTATSSLIAWSNDIEGTKVTDVHFSKCKFVKGNVGISAIYSTALRTEIEFTECQFYLCGKGIYLQGISEQDNRWRINGSRFELIFNQAVHATSGYGMSIADSTFLMCANGLNDAATPILPVVEFGQGVNNTVLDCYFDRPQAAGVSTTALAPGTPEVLRSSKTSIVNNVTSGIAKSDGERTLAVFSCLHRYINIDYVLTLGTYVRKGKLAIVIDNSESPATVSFTDDYNYTAGATAMTNFEFGQNILDNDGDSGLDTVQLWYKNPLATGLIGNITYFVTYGV
jgi:hypothetical protein